MRFILSFVLLFVWALELAACQPDPPATWSVRSAGATGPSETIHFADPDGDLKSSLASGDRRFVGIMGQALNLPGVPRDDQPFIRGTFGAKVVEGISDVENEVSARIGVSARAYAEKYNAALLIELAKLKATTRPPP